MESLSFLFCNLKRRGLRGFFAGFQGSKKGGEVRGGGLD